MRHADPIFLALSVLWPGLMPGSTNGGSHAGVQSWFSLAGRDHVLHTTLLYGSYSHKRALWLFKGKGRFGADDRKMMNICETESINAINKAIQDPNCANSDAVILSVLCMATNESEDLVRGDTKFSPFQAPFRNCERQKVLLLGLSSFPASESHCSRETRH